MQAVRLELELKEEKVAFLTQELDELTFGGSPQKTRSEMDKKLKEQVSLL
jgi:hypothetical protein